MACKARDALDRNLIALLERDAREPTSSLARRLGVARTTVKERIARLERDGIIAGYSAVIRLDMENQPVKAMVFITCIRNQIDRIIARLHDLPEVSQCMTVSGRHDLLCHVEVPQNEDIDALLDEIASYQGVTAMETTIVLSTRFGLLNDWKPAKPQLRLIE